MICCCVTNHPKTQCFKTVTISVSHDSVAWLDSSSAGLAYTALWNCVHLVGLLELQSLEGLTLMSGTLAGMVGKLGPLSPHGLSSVFGLLLFSMMAEPEEGTGGSYNQSLDLRSGTFTVSLLLHSKGQSKSPGQPRFKW